tara:strand:+ start:660 stop:2411 length:1752 start_codon:yes stop_codon:yes gene_type:complete
MKKIFKKKIILFLLISLSFINHAYSVDIPTVDDLNNQVPQLPEKKAPNASENLNQLNEKILTVDEDKILKVLVKDFKIDGNKRYNDELLLSLINENINKELDYNALLNVTTSLSNYYRSQGYLATAYLPPQDIKNGVVNIKITEAILGKITFNVDEGQKLNISKEKIRLKILYKVEDGGGLNISQLDKNIRNFNRTPGINAIAQLEEGKKFGETDIVVTASNTKTISGSSLADNTGSRSSGTGKITNTINMDGLFNLGERFSFTNVATGNNFIDGKQSEESNYYAMSTSFPMGYNGMQGTLRLSKMEYKLSAPFDSTLPSGYSTEYNFTLTRPLIEKLSKNLNATFLISRNDYVNNLSTGNNSNKDMTKATMNFGYDFTDTKLGGGVNYGLFGFTLGKLDVSDNSANFITDQAGADNNGRNLKAIFNYNRLQKITDKTNMLLKFNGQLAADNLDGAEQLTLGGPSGVRAYASSEGAGDAGFVTGIELKRSFFNLPTTLFYDYGKIRLHKDKWVGWNSTNKYLKNKYALKGWGVATDISVFNLFTVQISHSQKIMGNSGEDTNGLDVDGLRWNDRTLITLRKDF